MSKKKAIIAVAVIVVLLLLGSWMYYTGILAKILYILLMMSIPPTPKETIPQWPKPPQNVTFAPPSETSQAAVNETRIAVERIELIKVADKIETYTDVNMKPVIEPVSIMDKVHLLLKREGWWVEADSVMMGYYEGKMAIVAAFPANEIGVFVIKPKPDLRLRTVTGTLRLRVSFATDITSFVVLVDAPSPRNPSGGPSPWIFAVVADQYADASYARASGAFFGKNFFIHPDISWGGWVVYDFNYSDLWPGPENIIGWPLDPDARIAIRFSAKNVSVGKAVPFDGPYFAAVGVDTTVYEPSAVCRITVRNNFTSEFIALRVRAKSDYVYIPLSRPLKPGESVSATVSFLEEFKLGETYDITIEAIYVHMITEDCGEFREIVKTVQVPCVGG